MQRNLLQFVPNVIIFFKIVKNFNRYIHRFSKDSKVVQFIRLNCVIFHTFFTCRSYEQIHMEVGRAICLGDHIRHPKGVTDETQPGQQNADRAAWIYDSGCDSYFHTDAEQCPEWSG